MKRCFRCNKKIEDLDHYYAFTEFNKEKKIRTDYAHKTCWDDFLKQVKNTDIAMGMLRGLKGPLTKMGLLEPEKVIIK